MKSMASTSNTFWIDQTKNVGQVDKSDQIDQICNVDHIEHVDQNDLTIRNVLS